jgi:hypothetical protein
MLGLARGVLEPNLKRQITDTVGFVNFKGRGYQIAMNAFVPVSVRAHRLKKNRP